VGIAFHPYLRVSFGVMDALRAYLNSLSTPAQVDFARRCGTSIGYLRKALSKGTALSESLCINIERESKQAVNCESLRPAGVDWAYIRSAPAPRFAENTPANGADVCMAHAAIREGA
jgi:DNA-binding transcriptional regulator YdaS (Cro superfamily)